MKRLATLCLHLACLASVLTLGSCTSDTKDPTGNVTPTTNDCPAVESLPNIVFLLIDDLGISSVPAYGNPSDSTTGWTSLYTTRNDSIEYLAPNIASLAEESRVYTNMYATSLCAPSRGQLITGRYPFRNGIVYPGWDLDAGPAPYDTNDVSGQAPIISALGYLDSSQVGYPAVLRAMGYETAFGGKWNLRYGQTMCDLDGKQYGDTTGYLGNTVPNQASHLNAMGFDQTFGPVALVGNTIDYYPPQLEDEGSLSKQYLPNALYDWMLTTLSGREAGTPQYIHYCFGLIHDPFNGACNDEHGPFSPPPPFTGKTQHDSLMRDSVWAQKMMYVDGLVGKFVRAIDSVDSVNNTQTMIILAGDNGTENEYFSNFNNTWVPGGKFTNTSNGARVPFMVRWKGVVTKGADNTLSDFADVFPTMVELVQGEDALDSLVNVGNPGFHPSYKGGKYPEQTASSYTLDGQSLLYDMTGGNLGCALSPRTGIYAQTNGQALIANEGYKLGIETDVGFYQINNVTLADDSITGATLISAIGDSAVSNPFSPGSPEAANYDSLVTYYYTLFPAANPGD